MATLNLNKVWINRLDTGAAISAPTAPGRPRNTTKLGEVRTYAGGRQRAITQAGRRGSFAFTLRMVPLATVQLLEDWLGVPVQVRDHKGQLFTGVYFEAPGTEYRDRNAWDVSITLSTVTVATSGV